VCCVLGTEAIAEGAEREEDRACRATSEKLHATRCRAAEPPRHHTGSLMNIRHSVSDIHGRVWP